MATQKSAGAAKVRPVDESFEPAAEARVDADTPVDSKQHPAIVAEPAKTKSKKGKGRFVFLMLAAAAIGAGGYYGHDWWEHGRFMVSTDDAYIEGDITNIAPKVTGYVAKVNVVANQHVKKDDALVTLDNGDYRIAAEQADAQIATQRLSLNRFDAQIEAAKAALAQAQAQKEALEAVLRGAVITEKRASELVAKSAGTIADRDNARVALDQAKANLAGADSAIASAKANISVVTAQRAEAESQIASLELQKQKAERDLGFTVLKAPFDGVVGNMAVQEGDLVSPGQRLAALVPVEELYIEANFKETQVADIKPGAEVDIRVDALGGEVFKGHVASIAPASGAVFSLLPPENATGNFTKVIQRVPVRIAIPREALQSGHLRAGLSVVAEIDRRTGGEKTKVAQSN